MCGVGTQSRIRKCPGFTIYEDVQNHCYNPRVRRHKDAPALMTNDPESGFQTSRTMINENAPLPVQTTVHGRPAQGPLENLVCRFDSILITLKNMTSKVVLADFLAS